MHKDDFILAERYLENTLTKEELVEVEARIESDLDFQELVQFIKDTQGAIVESKKKEFIGILNEVEKNYHQDLEPAFHNAAKEFPVNEEEAKVVKFNFNKKLLMVASVLLIIGISSLLVFNNSSNNFNNGDLALVKELYNNSDNEIKLFPVLENNNLSGDLNTTTNGNSEVLYNLPIITIKSDEYQKHYFYNDTLFLFGDLGANLIVYEDTLNTIILIDGLKKYKIKLNKTEKIEELQEVVSSFNKIPKHE